MFANRLEHDFCIESIDEHHGPAGPERRTEVADEARDMKNGASAKMRGSLPSSNQTLQVSALNAKALCDKMAPLRRPAVPDV
jgi:hypothetical protein